MIMLALVAVILVFGIAYGMSRREQGDAIARPNALMDVRTVKPTTALQRWVDAGLISDEQARAIAAFEAAQVAARPRSRVSPVVEALAYVGGVLLAVGAGMLIGQHWDELGTGGHLGVLTAAAIVTGVVGAVVGESDPAAWRLRGFLWALSSVALGVLAGLFVFEVLDTSGDPVALATAGVTALAAGGFWQLRDRPLQHTIVFLGLAVSIGVAIAWAGAGNVTGFVGLALWLFGGAWAALAWMRRVPPAMVGFPLGIVLTLVASGIVGGQVDWLAPLLGLATATAWVGAGVLSNERLSLAPGVVGVFVFLPWTLGHFFGETLGAPAIAMLSGALLLGVVVLLLRRSRTGGAGRVPGGHFRPAPAARQPEVTR